MSSDPPSVAESMLRLWSGRVISALMVLALTMSGVMKLVQPDALVQEFGRLGYPVHTALPIGIIELVCTVLYLVPKTSVLGAILLTGYLGGATATHVRINDQFLPPVIMGVMVWLGLYLRDARLRALLPLKKQAT